MRALEAPEASPVAIDSRRRLSGVASGSVSGERWVLHETALSWPWGELHGCPYHKALCARFSGPRAWSPPCGPSEIDWWEQP